MRTHKQNANNSGSALFASGLTGVPGAERPSGPRNNRVQRVLGSFECNPMVDLVEVFERAVNPEDPKELLSLLIGRVDTILPLASIDSEPANRWKASRARRDVKPEEIAVSPVIPSFFKALFDFYFRKDLYGHWIQREPYILSSGSFDESAFGLPWCLKECIRYALTQNWYGYSDSRGRIQTRAALAELESSIAIGGPSVEPSQIAVTLGTTSATASLADFVSKGRPKHSLKALCGIPNYPPLVASIGRLFDTELVFTPLIDGNTSIETLIERARKGADLLLLQAVSNPWGSRVSLADIKRLVEAAPKHCIIVLDMAHDCFGPTGASAAPGAALTELGDNVVLMRSLSKRWGAPGLKCGWMVGSSDIIDEFYTHASTTYGGPPSIFYLLLETFARFEAVYRGDGSIGGQILKHFEPAYQLSQDTIRIAYDDYLASANRFYAGVAERREQAVELLTRDGLEVYSPLYSINVFVQGTSLPDYAIYRSLIHAQNVSVFPSSLCMLPSCGGIRLSPCLPQSALTSALERIIRWREDFRI